MPWRDEASRNLGGNTNRGPDSRFGHTYANAGRITRGMLFTEPWQGRGTTQRFRFMVNPSEIALSYMVNDDMLDETNPDMLGINGGVVAQDDGFVSIAFSMLIDRTYDVWSGRLPEGALHDIRQLERVLGPPFGGPRETTSDSSFMDRVRDAMDRATDAALSSRGLIMRRPATVIFGGEKAFSFYGFVDNLSVSLMKFSRDMVATRAGIQISMSSYGVNPQERNSDMEGDGGYGSFWRWDFDAMVEEAASGNPNGFWRWDYDDMKPPQKDPPRKDPPQKAPPSAYNPVQVGQGPF